MQPNHLLDLIRQVKPKAALFTTYTFSVSYFDSVFVPALRSVGCHEIAVLLDADEAALCAQEFQSRAAGLVYWVAPVRAPGGGVFHPKVAYLMSDTDDVLSVGSGNITASGQALQLESFDAVSVRQAPDLFVTLAEWMTVLAEQTGATSPQASSVLSTTARRARAAARRHARAADEGRSEPVLVHTLKETARSTLEAMFLAQAARAATVTVLSPFHSPDGGPVVRLADAVSASNLEIGLDGTQTAPPVPFAEGRFLPGRPGRYVQAEEGPRRRRLHAKVFELRAPGKVLVMTGSVNATAQSFESKENVEVSLARWLPQSPFQWNEVRPAGFAVTQEASDFGARPELYVDAWLQDDRMLHGRVTGRAGIPTSVQLRLESGGAQVFGRIVALDGEGSFKAGPVADLSTSQATLLTMTSGELKAVCWLNIHEQLELAPEERGTRAALARVLRGDYAAEDVGEVLRLLTVVAQGIPAAQSHRSAEGKAMSNEDTAASEPFSFGRWATSGQRQETVTGLTRSPVDLLKALNRWLNSDLETAEDDEDDEGEPTLKPRDDLDNSVCLLPSAGDDEQDETEDEEDGRESSSNSYALLDQVCQGIALSLETHGGNDSSDVLAEVVVARAVERSLKEDLKMAPCLAWLEKFSRFQYPNVVRARLTPAAVALACVTAHGLDRRGLDPQFAAIREATERLAGQVLSADQWSNLCDMGLARDTFQRVSGRHREKVHAMAGPLSEAKTLASSLLSLLHKASAGLRARLVQEPEAAMFPDVVAALRERTPRKRDLMRGLLASDAASREGVGCPFCFQALSSEQRSGLRQRYAIVHKDIRCNRVLLLADPAGRLQQGIEEMNDA